MSSIKIADRINGTYEACGGLFIALSCWKLYCDKQVHGVSWLHMGFFWTWGIWNLWYYAQLQQRMSWWGGLGVVCTNGVWLAMALYYGS